MNDVRFAFRQLLKNPGFAAVAVLTLALGIGANTAIFGLINELLLQPLPIKEPEKLFGIVLVDETGDFADQNIPYPILRDFGEQISGIFSELSGYAPVFAPAEIAGQPQFATAQLATEKYFSTLGIQPALGRFFAAGDDQLTDQGVVAVLSHGAWRSWFNEDASVVGATVQFRPAYADPVNCTVVGVAPEQGCSKVRQDM
ncbi:MAG: ABC transporter permease [Verrucomicrobia bacterium]|nr:ABC transporter permease [Verrucomicrobiota bacterium]